MAIAKIPTVSNFLCYFDLSTGGLILGWFDAVIYGIVLFILILNMFMGMEIMSREQLDNFSVLGLVIDSVVQLVILGFFFGISVAFIRGIKSKSPKMCLPFVVLAGLQAGVAMLEGLVFLNLGFLIISLVKIYLFIVVYSLHKVFTYGDEQAAYEAHQNASSAGYEQYYEPEGYNQEGYNQAGYNNIENNETARYQTTEFKGP